MQQFSIKKCLELRERYGYHATIESVGPNEAYVQLSSPFFRSPYGNLIVSRHATPSYLKKFF